MGKPLCMLQHVSGVSPVAQLYPPATSVVTAEDRNAAWAYISPQLPASSSAARGDSGFGQADDASKGLAEALTAAAASTLWASMLATVFAAADMSLLPPESPSQSLALPLRMAIIGPPGCGCSTLARALADKFNLKARNVFTHTDPTAPFLLSSCHIYSASSPADSAHGVLALRLAGAC